MRAKACPRVAILIALATTAALTMAVAAPSRADVDADVRAGVFPSADAVGVGAGILTHIGHDRWYANPNAEFVTGDDDMFSLNGDFHYDVSSDRSTTFWLGAGPAIIVQDNGGDNSTDLGINLLAGLGATRGDVRPFGQIKGVMSDNGGVALVGGVRF